MQEFFVSSLYLFDSIFSGIIWIGKLYNCDEETCFPTNGCHGNRKRQFSFIIGTVPKSKKRFFKIMNLTDINYYWLDEKKCWNLKNIHLEEKGPGVKYITFLHLITTFHNYALKIENGLAKRGAEPILESRNAAWNVVDYLRSIFYWHKVLIWSPKDH